MKNNLENQDIKTDKPLAMSYEALKADRDALAERVERISGMLNESRHATKVAEERADALAVEKAERGEIIERLVGIFGASGYHAVQNSIDPCSALMYDAMQVLKGSDTSSALAAIEARAKAEAFEEIIEFIDRRSGLAEMKTQWDLSSAIVAHIAKLREAK